MICLITVYIVQYNMQYVRWPSEETMLISCCSAMQSQPNTLAHHIPANTRHWTNVCLMLGQRRRRWANIKPTLVQRLVFAGILTYNVIPAAAKTLVQHKNNVWSVYRACYVDMYSVVQSQKAVSACKEGRYCLLALHSSIVHLYPRQSHGQADDSVYHKCWTWV